MKKTTQKLQLQRQTLRVLVKDDLQRIAGGRPGGSDLKPCTNNDSSCAGNYSVNC